MATLTPLSRRRFTLALSATSEPDTVSEIGEHLGNSAHANAADADEMHRTDVARQFHGFALSPFDCALARRHVLQEAQGRNKAGG